MILTESIDELEEKIGTLSRISRMKDREIEGLKARLYPRNERDMITNISELHVHELIHTAVDLA